MYNNPFDFTKMFNQYDPATAMNEQMQKMFGQFTTPNVDMQALVAAQQKNMEALTAANRAVVEGTQELMKRQAEIMQEAMTEAAAMAKDLKTNSDPSELAQQQAKLMENAMQKALANATELGEIMTRTQQEAGQLMSARYEEAMKEVKDAMPK